MKKNEEICVRFGVTDKPFAYSILWDIKTHMQRYTYFLIFENTDECRYNAFQYNKILYASPQWRDKI